MRINGLYWGLTALHLLGRPDALPRRETIDFILSCQHKNGGFGAAPGHDAHLLYTVSAVQSLVMIDAVEDLERNLDGKGKDLVGKCECLHVCDSRGATINTFDVQTLRTYKIRIRELFPEMSGVRKTLDFSMQRSMLFPC